MRYRLTKRKFAIAVAWAWCTLLVTAEGQHASPGAPLRPQHAAVIEKWLARRPGLRVATEADCRNQSGLHVVRGERGKAYQPYYAVGDFNGDGKEDFAVAFRQNKKSKAGFVVAVFDDPSGNPTFLSDEVDLRDGGLFLLNTGRKPSERRLAMGTFQSDDCVILQPRSKGYVLKPCV